jgi:hypothetical protein
LHKLQAIDEVPEPWQIWQTAATATPAEIRVAANPIIRWRRERLLSDFMVVLDSLLVRKETGNLPVETSLIPRAGMSNTIDTASTGYQDRHEHFLHRRLVK